MIFFSYRLPYDVTVGTLTSLASSKPFNPTTGVDNNGDGNNNDRPVINGAVAGRYSFRGTPISDVSLFGEVRVKVLDTRAITLRVEGFNMFNHANVLARNGTYGDTGHATGDVRAGDAGARQHRSWPDGAVPGALHFLTRALEILACLQRLMFRPSSASSRWACSPRRFCSGCCCRWDTTPSGSGQDGG